MYMIRMHACRCDTSNDISICNLKKCLNASKNTRTTQTFMYFLTQGFKIQECEKIFSGNLEF